LGLWLWHAGRKNHDVGAVTPAPWPACVFRQCEGNLLPTERYARKTSRTRARSRSLASRKGRRVRGRRGGRERQGGQEVRPRGKGSVKESPVLGIGLKSIGPAQDPLSNCLIYSNQDLMY
jgi:hypothetical protein